MEQFAVEETVLARDGPLYYDARIRVMQYLVHYQGWKQSFDRWLESDCLLKNTNSNVALADQLTKGLDSNDENPISETYAISNEEDISAFMTDETVLARDGALFYPAKIKEIKYLVHYQGWKPRFDRWLATECLLKYTESNLEYKNQLKKELDIEKMNATKKRRTKSLPDASIRQDFSPSASIPPTKKIAIDPLEVGTNSKAENDIAMWPTKPASKRKNSYNNTTTVKESLGLSATAPALESPSNARCMRVKAPSPASNDTLQEIMVQKDSEVLQPSPKCQRKYEWCQTKKGYIIPMPEELKMIIKEDHDILKAKKKELRLPACPTIEEVLGKYVEYKKSQTFLIPEIISEIESFACGVNEYVAVLLDEKLLYKWEKARHDEVMKKHKGTPISQIYGTVHLLRMIREIGPYIETIKDDHTLQLMIFHFCELLKYVHENAAELLKDDMYVNVS